MRKNRSFTSIYAIICILLFAAVPLTVASARMITDGAGRQVEILKLIRRVVREHPVCAIMTMHDLSTALRFADKCIFLKDGGIHAAIPAQQVTAEIIHQVYGIAVEIYHHNGYPVVIPN
jgi:ABC-type cobalamin/Fe3+-siderophores transport system ATPase subunit